MEEEDSNGVNMEINDLGTSPTLSNHVSNGTSVESSPNNEPYLPSNKDSKEPLNSTKKRRNVLSDSEEDKPTSIISTEIKNNGLTESGSDSEDDTIFKKNSSKSRIKSMSSSEDEDTEHIKPSADSDSNSSKIIGTNDNRTSAFDSTMNKTHDNKTNSLTEKVQSSSEDEDNSIFKKNASKLRIKAMSSSEDSDSGSSNMMTSVKSTGVKALDSTPIITQDKPENSNSSSSDDEVTRPGSNSDSSSKETEQNMRLKNKRSKLSQKFKSLIQSRNGLGKDENDNSGKSGSENADSDEVSSIEKIKQKIRDRSNHLKSTIYDPDTSDDERAHHIETNKRKVKTKPKKAESPKPVRMSAKQAMENMQKIKSESNRMLREKVVSLPYHRPKALSLKDIMSRRKPALAADGKALPLKMNEDQLRQYALQLEERQKEMIELCKSETEGEDEEIKDTSDTNDNTNTEEQSNDNPDKNKVVNDNNDKQNIDTTAPEDSNDISQVNDDLFDTQVSKDSLYETAAEDTLKDNTTLQESNEVGPNTEDESQLMKLRFDSELVTDSEKNLTDTMNEIQETDLNKDNGEDIVKNNKLMTDQVDEELVKKGSDENKSSKTDHIDDKLVRETSIDNADVQDEDDKITAAFDNPKGILLNEESKGAAIDVSEKAKDEAMNEEQAMDVSESIEKEISLESKENVDEEIDGFSDDDIDMADIDKMIEDADIIVEKATQNDSTIDSPMLIRDLKSTILKPKLTGAPGMVIDLDGTDATGPKKLSGIELLKERFTFFATLKTPEEIERQKQNRVKPGIQHLKLKQQLEDEIAEQRSIEWAKRLEEEKQQQAEMKALRGDDDEDDYDDLEKIEAKIDDKEEIDNNDESEGESEPEENDVILEDKPSKKNPLLDDEAEESDDENDKANEADDEENGDENGDSEDDESSESSDDDLDADMPKKGRILKAFEDSDDEEDKTKIEIEAKVVNLEVDRSNGDLLEMDKEEKETDSQDVELESAQLQKSISEDIFASQDSGKTIQIQNNAAEDITNKASINISENVNKLTVISETQPYDEVKFDEIAGMCSGSFSQNATTISIESTQQQTQEIGDNVLALCTGNFYGNQFVDNPIEKADNSTDLIGKDDLSTKANEVEQVESKLVEENNKIQDKKLLQSILLELDDPEFDDPKPNKFFTGGDKSVEKKRFVIDSDDEEATEVVKKKRKRKLEDRALQISDDEEEEEELVEEEEELISDLEGDDAGERLVEYDSEENEVELKQDPKTKKAKRKTTDFFEQEAELTSEDEWVGSGDEDEGGLDRMEREEGDSDTFHQGRLQAELGQIHMRDVMDQDKREVRLLQELLLEDGDLGGGSRQRKFRWKNADGEEDTGTNVDEFGDSQQDEFETEEQWRKQRHERDVFLKSMMQKDGDPEETPSPISFNRSAIIKANLNKTANTSVHLEVTPVNENHTVEKTTKDVPSPVKKPFGLLQANFRGSILSRGSGTLARLGALAAPLATDDDKAGSITNTRKGNFVFATLSPAEEKPKMSKRKAEDVGTPNLMKKLKTDEKRKISAKTSLLDHFKT